MNKLEIPLYSLSANVLSFVLSNSSPRTSAEEDIDRLLKKHQMNDMKVTYNASGRLAQCMLESQFFFDRLIAGLKLENFNSIDENNFKYHN